MPAVTAGSTSTCELDPARLRDACRALGWLAVLRARLGIDRHPQPQHVHADRDRDRRGYLHLLRTTTYCWFSPKKATHGLVRDVDGIVKRELAEYSTSSMPSSSPIRSKHHTGLVHLLPRLVCGCAGPLRPRLAAGLRGPRCAGDFPVGFTVCGAFGHPPTCSASKTCRWPTSTNPPCSMKSWRNGRNSTAGWPAAVWAGVQFDFLFIWEDIAYKNGSLISPRFVRQFMLPYYRRLIEDTYAGWGARRSWLIRTATCANWFALPRSRGERHVALRSSGRHGHS